MRVEVIPMAEGGLVRCAQVARVAREVAEAVLSTYRSKYSKHLFTQPSLLAILCLMRYEDWTFREAEVRLAEHQELRTALGVERVPDYTTLYRFLRRVVLGQLAYAGPANASSPLRPVVDLARQTGVIGLVVADAEFDSECSHRHIRDQLGADSIIPAKRGKPSWQLHGIRAQMRANFPTARYRQRALVESVFSAATRKLASRAPGRLPATQHLHVLLLGLAHDIYRVRRARSLSLR